jgi:hypothetical protein
VLLGSASVIHGLAGSCSIEFCFVSATGSDAPDGGDGGIDSRFSDEWELAVSRQIIHPFLKAKPCLDRPRLTPPAVAGRR